MTIDTSQSPAAVPPASAGSRAERPDDDGFARQLRGFGPVGILAILVIILVGNDVILPLGALLTLAWARLSGTPWRTLGFVRPKSWPWTVALGIVFGVAFKLVMKAVVMPLFGADPINHAYHYLVGNTAALPLAVYSMIVSAGFGEELVFRGFLFERLGTLFRHRPWSKPVIVVLTSILFGLGHYTNMGIPGVEQALITGATFGTIYALTGRIWLPMIAHAAFDLAAVAIIYWGLETRVAHFFFH